MMETAECSPELFMTGRGLGHGRAGMVEHEGLCYERLLLREAASFPRTFDIPLYTIRQRLVYVIISDKRQLTTCLLPV